MLKNIEGVGQKSPNGAGKTNAADVGKGVMGEQGTVFSECDPVF
jgi:hypothetical protein